MIESTDVGTCLEIMQLREPCFDSPTGLSLALKLWIGILKQHALSHSMFTQTVLRLGDYYGHIAISPVLDSMMKKAEKKSPLVPVSPNFRIGFSTLLLHTAIYMFKIQPSTSPKHQPTKDTRIVCDKLASLPDNRYDCFPRQDSFS